ncbi:MAG TPA: AMP-binding protein [Pseudonocardia sp.]|jgi:acyl-CoA synthetase (AMP-forming)/AMP-acid ligase II
MTGTTAPHPQADDLLVMTVPGVLRAHAREHPDQVYLWCGGVEYTYGQLWELSGRVATWLAGRGLRRGDRVTTWLPNDIEWIVAAFALGRLGVVNVLTNSRFRAREVAALVHRSGSRGLVTLRAPGEQLGGACEWTVTTGGTDRTWDDVVGTEIDTAAIESAAAGSRGSDPLYLIYTSGTTGLSKGSMTRHGPALKNAFNSGERMGFTDTDRLLCYLPMSHCFGAVNALLNTLTHGARLDLTADFEPKSVLAAIAERGITAIFGVPTHYAMLAEAHRAGGGADELGTLTKGCIAGAAVSDELVESLEVELAISGLTHAYGMTESSAIISQTAWDEPLPARLQTSGAAMPDTEVRLVDQQTGAQARPGEPGVIQIRGFHVHAGYLGLAEDPSAREDGWWDTGDIASADERGRLSILGRTKDMYKTSGFNVYPAEVEAYLVTHPAIAEVAVVGVPHPRKAETGTAFVIAAPGSTVDPSEIVAFARDGLAGYKVPEHVLVVDDFPRSSATLKIQKHLLRVDAQKILGISQ